jgi:hypothetical protein
VGLATIAAFWTAANLWTAHGTRTQADELSDTIATQETRYRQIARQLAPTRANGEVMKRSVEVFDALRESARDPVPMMAAISEAFESSPHIVLREFGWTHSAAEIRRGQAGPPASTVPPKAGGSPAGRRQSAYVQGEIRAFRGDYRAAIATIDTLADRLREHPHVAEVRTIRMPLDVTPNAVLSGNTLDSREVSVTAEFELLIVYKPGA